jgi:tetratricopeptide (TPR) repeat protein
MTAHYDRALVLYQQSRYDLAEQELRQELAIEPNNDSAHALLALCLCGRKEYEAATREAEEAVRLAPDASFSHYALARALYHQDHLREAERVVREALALAPWDGDCYALLASICFDERRWADALEAAEQGLAFDDAEHPGCVNLRAMALVKLGRRAEAGATLGDALQRDPEDALTHANQGWTLLEQRQPEKALEHFREALRLEPNLEWAREGIVEALKARNWLYRQMLRYFLWMRRLSQRAQWGVLVGLLVAQNVLRSALPPALEPLGEILFWCLIVFAILTWTADPLFNLLLRLNRLGRLALSRQQIWASNCVGACLLLALAALVGWAVSEDFRFAMAALVSACLVLPVAGSFKCPAGGRRVVMASYTILLAAMGFGALGIAAFIEQMPREIQGLAVALFKILFFGFLLGTVASTWLFNLLVLTRLRR